MLVISNSVQKSGSTLLANYQEGILGKVDIRSGQRALRETIGGRFIGQSPFTPYYILKALYVARRHGTIVIKNHWDYNLLQRYLGLMVKTKTTFCYRDPRDVVLSAMDHAKRSREGLDRTKAFIHCSSFGVTLRFVKTLFDRMDLWMQKEVFWVKYEDLMEDPQLVLTKMVEFLQWDVSDDVIGEVILEQDRLKAKAWNFNKGTSYRWREEMNRVQLEEANTVLAPYIKKLGYDF